MSKYKIDHLLYEDIEFNNYEAVQAAAERLTQFVVRTDSECYSCQVEILSFYKDEDDEIERWWWEKTIKSELSTTAMEMC